MAADLIHNESYALRPIGKIRSGLAALAQAPRQGGEGAPDAWLELAPGYAVALQGLVPGDQIIVVTWLHLAERARLQVHPRGDAANALTGVFATRSPHRPNPLGLHSVTVRELDGARLLVGPIEAIDGTPVVDIKIALPASGEA
jgi:tRNA-Thr(GGU) m(6)t(6)A37 methyltransferase TsaA